MKIELIESRYGKRRFECKSDNREADLLFDTSLGLIRVSEDGLTREVEIDRKDSLEVEVLEKTLLFEVSPALLSGHQGFSKFRVTLPNECRVLYSEAVPVHQVGQSLHQSHYSVLLMYFCTFRCSKMPLLRP